MSKQAKFWVALLTIAAFAQSACYNRYFVTKDELEKLESGVEVQEVVTVQADCPKTGSAEAPGTEKGPTVAASDEASKSGESNGSEQASDASPPTEQGDEKEGETKGEKKKGGKKSTNKAGCTQVPVSTSNAINVVLDNGEQRRVTPFNFMMSEQQLVSPEYDLLLSLDRVKGANVREFSTWKTVGMIAGVTAVTVGTFVGLSLTSEDPEF